MTEQEALMLAQAGIDGSGTLLIDADTRSIYVPESEKFFGVESDQNVETYQRCICISITRMAMETKTLT